MSLPASTTPPKSKWGRNS